ncbi:MULTISPECIES: MFS transporter [Sphingomonas]|uniref:MFS transporter n=1 Tax=Sphingomonas hankookensis TaxID=563996 RepID=A0ABR5Y9E6_9SPHN|nr:MULTISPECIES: MFS transporter [Sphingomonas]KZE11425.1 MFS transporter [Sphingomonas hankookensis]PZT92530.1 MAG: MFS transporter [Sphingomonas sp.]RSV19590.1 MFS transporter [Sphingomonas sp. ABOLH]WCP72113.1 MFS transporter [Sphingomonas hankookensis]
MAQTRAGSATTGLAFAAVTTLFFAWGFITSLIDPLVAAVKGIFTLSDFEAQFAASAFFLAYGLVSMPAAILLGRLKAVPSILFALITMVVGCLTMLVAANLAVFPIVLLGLFILASGITILQVAANPLAAALGDPKLSHFRLTLSQTFNSFGTFLGPLLGASLFLEGVEVKDGTVLTEAVRAGALAGIDRAYFWIAGLIAALAVFFFLSRKVVSAAVPEAPANTPSPAALLRDAFSSRWAVLGAAAIFIYVGAEVAIGTQMALFLNADAWAASDAAFGVPLLGLAMGSDGVPGVSLQEAGKAVAFYWLGAMVGRAIGSVLLSQVKAHKLLALFTGIAVAMCLYVAFVGGVGAGFVALAIGLFNSIMFPVIFTLTLERSTASEAATSGLLCTAIFGGAVIPLIVGLVSGALGHGAAFVVPALCYAALCAFAIAAGRTPPRNAASAKSLH